METTSTAVIDWRARAGSVLPSYADDDAVMSSVAALLAECDGSTLDGSAEALAGILSDAAGLAVWAALPDMSHGDVSPERDYHGWVRNVVETYTASGAVVDTVPAHASAPDPMEGSRHAVRRGRSKRGATAVVTHYGAAFVVGSWEHDVHGGLTPERLTHTAEMLHVRRGAYGTSVFDVERVTALTYERTGEIDALLSTENRQHAQVIHAGNGAVDEHAVTHHNPRDLYGAAGLDDSRSVGPIGYPYRGRGLTFGLPTECVTDRAKLTAWLASYRDVDATSAARIASRCDVVTFRPTIARQSTRRRLTVPRKRKLDVAARTLRANSYCWSVSELLAPAADVDHVWRGHQLVTRPTAQGGTTVRGKRNRVARVKRTIGATFHAETTAALVAHFGTIPAGGRVQWTCGPLKGTYTLSPNRRHNMTCNGDHYSRRTTTALERILSRQTWLTAQPA